MRDTMLWLIFAGLLAGSGSGLAQPAPKAVAQLPPTKGSTVNGTATFTQLGDKVLVEAKISGLKPIMCMRGAIAAPAMA